MDDMVFIDLFGADNLERFEIQKNILDMKGELINDVEALSMNLNKSFCIDIRSQDLLVSSSAGVILGLSNALFKNHVPQKGPLRHKHKTTLTAVDYKVPKPRGYKGSVVDLHRQIGPSHDIFRFKDALDLMAGNKSDFNLWGTTATKILGHELTPGNMSLADFRRLGGFRIPENPKAELLHHLLIDFFTRRSLPLPGSTYIADLSPELARLMLTMYDNGLNLKNLTGNFIGFSLVQLIMHSYAFLFKGIMLGRVPLSSKNLSLIPKLYLDYTRSKEFDFLLMFAHGSSFFVDTLITTNTKAYAGVFQLNYLSLAAVAYHLCKYITKSSKDYKELLASLGEKSQDIHELDCIWYENFKEDLALVVDTEEFSSILNFARWKKQRQTIDSFQDELTKQKALLKKLREGL